MMRIKVPKSDVFALVLCLWYPTNQNENHQQRSFGLYPCSALVTTFCPVFCLGHCVTCVCCPFMDCGYFGFGCTAIICILLFRDMVGMALTTFYRKALMSQP